MNSLSRKVLVAAAGALIVLFGCYTLLASDLALWNDSSAHVMRDNERSMLDGRFQVALTRAVGESASYAITGQPDYRTEAVAALQQAQEAIHRLRQLAEVAPLDEGSDKDKALLERQGKLLEAAEKGLKQAFATQPVQSKQVGSADAVDILSLIYAHEAETDALWDEIAGHHSTERTRNEQTLRDHSRGAQRLVLTGVAAFAFALVLLIFYVRHRLVQPLTALTRLTGRIAAGDLSVRAVVTRRDEVGQLGRSFNTMVDQLAKQRSEVSALLDSLGQARDTAQAANRAKSRFLANVSHEIRTPLHGVLVSLDLMHETAPSPEQRELADIARVSGRGLLRMLNDLLDASRFEAGGLPLEEVTFETRRLVTRSVELCGRRAAEKGLAVTCHVADDVPASICGDPLRLAQILVNLLDNAVKFTERGSIGVSVSRIAPPRTWIAPVPGLPMPSVWLRFCVTDTGVGVPPELARKIFEPFYQSEPTYPHGQGGLGLGLAIARQLATRMGGELAFESTPGQGSSFWFTVRMKSEALCETSEPAHPPQPRQFAAGGLVLLADDHHDIRNVMARTLQRRGLTVITAENGRLAVALAREQRFDLILMDCRMPVMDGFEATLAIRALGGEHGAVPIVALTAYGLTEPRQRYLDAGFDDLIVKPYTLEELEAALYRWLVVNRRDGAASRPAQHAQVSLEAEAVVPASRH